MENKRLREQEEDEDLLLCLLALLVAKKKKAQEARRLRAPRRFWQAPILQEIQEHGAWYHLIPMMRETEPDRFQNFMRMSPDTFDELLAKVQPWLEAKPCRFREPLEAGEKLAITLRFLASGLSYPDVEFLFRVSRSTICLLVPKVCCAIRYELRDQFKLPKSPEEWQEIADAFYNRWQFPNCLGALDGKHVIIRQPNKSGTVYFNYKNSFSIVLMALVDADYRFIYTNVGAEGKSADGGVWGATRLARAMEHDREKPDEEPQAFIPQPAPIVNDDRDIPYAIVGDDAFALSVNLMKPYAHRSLSREEQIFNYRLSRARRIVENAFGIMANRWRILLTKIMLRPESTEDVVNACCALHNWLRRKHPTYTNHLLDREDPITHQVTPGLWREDKAMLALERMAQGRLNMQAKAQRDYLCAWMCSPAGAVPWQERMVP